MIQSVKPFIKIGYLGLAVIAMSIILLFVFPAKAPSLPEGFTTPIIAYEFIQTPEEVFQMFGGDNISIQKQMIASMDLGNWLDYLYMCLYAAFLMMFCAKCAALSRNKYYYCGVIIALAVLAGDALENVQLLSITANLPTGNFNGYLSLLNLFTWIKWGGIALIFLLLSPWLLKGGWFSKIVGITGIISLVLGAVASIHRSMINEIYSLSVALMFILMIIYCFTYRAKQNV